MTLRSFAEHRLAGEKLSRFQVLTCSLFSCSDFGQSLVVRIKSQTHVAPRFFNYDRKSASFKRSLISFVFAFSSIAPSITNITGCAIPNGVRTTECIPQGGEKLTINGVSLGSNITTPNGLPLVITVDGKPCVNATMPIPHFRVCVSQMESNGKLYLLFSF